MPHPPSKFRSNRELNPEPSERERGLQELIQRLHVREFHPDHVREAARIVAQVQTHKDSLQLAKRLIGSPLIQVRDFANHLLAAIHDKAGAAGQAEGQTESNPPTAPGIAVADSDRKPGYEAIAEIVKQWIREEKR